MCVCVFFFFQAEDGIRDGRVTGVQTCALPICAVRGVTQHPSGVEVAIERQGRTETRSGRWLIGADGARSDVRRSLGIAFDGFTWPDRFLVVSTPFDFHTVIP